MSHSTNDTKNKKQKHPKVHFQQYLYNSGEPNDDTSKDMPLELEAELLENSYFMKRQLRRKARMMRARYKT